MTRPAVFLDRDGVINRNRSDHVKSWEEFEFLPGALEGLRQLTKIGLPLIVVSNQGAIGRGMTTRAAVDEINRRMVAELRLAGARIDDVLYCPHHPDDGCACRKPRPGLLLEAAARWDLDLPRSILIGDAQSDTLAAENAGCRALLVLTGRGREQLDLLAATKQLRCEVAADLLAAARRIQAVLQPTLPAR